MEILGAAARSHLADGRVVGWYGVPGVVIDAELSDQPVPPALAARFGTEDFWGRWTRAEVAAKRADVPIVLWLAEHGLGPTSGAGETLEIEGITVSVAHRARARV
jgi:hypothetical protein